MRKIKSTGNVRPHALTFCDSCKWQEDESLHQDMEKLRSLIYSHIRKTGHRVTLETGYSNTYYLEEKQ